MERDAWNHVHAKASNMPDNCGVLLSVLVYLVVHSILKKRPSQFSIIMNFLGKLHQFVNIVKKVFNQ